MSLVSTLLFILVGQSAPSTKDLRKKLILLQSDQSPESNTKTAAPKISVKIIKTLLLTLFFSLIYFVLKLIFKFEFYDLISATEENLSKPYIKLSLMFCISLWLGGMLKDSKLNYPKRRLRARV